jgi:hypothetical protein
MDLDFLPDEAHFRESCASLRANLPTRLPG